MNFNRKGVPGGEAGYAALKEQLRAKTVDELWDEVGLIFEEEATTGKVADPELMGAYAEILMELTPDEVTEEEVQHSKDIFMRNHFSLGETHQHHPRPERRTSVRRSFVKISRKLVTVAAALTLMIGFLEVSGIDWKGYIFEWQRELFGIEAAPQSWGDSELAVPSESGYRSLEEALAAYQIDAAVPAHILGGFSVTDVDVSERPMWTSFSAVYEHHDGRNITIRVMCYPSAGDVPSIKLEKDANDPGDNYAHNGIDYKISTNLGRIEAIWNHDRCAYRLSGEISKEELKTMIDTIKES